jgi:anti-sigma B factor antagonist
MGERFRDTEGAPPLREFEVPVPSNGDVGIVRVSGEIDVATAPALREQLASALEIDVIDVVVDLGEVTFMDSTGLSVLIDACHRLGKSGRKLHVVGATPSLRRLFEIAGVTELLDVQELVDPAQA